jgi:enoyl-CoA hydratase/carnithine racemase
MEVEEQAPAALLFEIIDKHIAFLRFNRPQARNAVDGETARSMSAAVQRIEADSDIRVVVLASSSPGMFCAGADLKVVSSGRIQELRPDENGFAGLIDSIRTKPWIVAVDGPALGGGFEICLACDIVVATPNARFGLPEVKRGLMANGGGAHRVTRVLPRNIALELVATGDPMDAEAAKRFGLVNRLVPVGQLLDEALGIARTIMANAPVSVRESLSLARIACDRPDAEMRRISRAGMQNVLATEDSKEGPRAFVEKRAPNWLGR